jgi:microcin C transport system permease protein
MGAYILRRLLLMIPTLFGIMVVNFALTQFVPGGPVEQVLAQLMMWNYMRFDFGESYFRSDLRFVSRSGDREDAGVDHAGPVVDADRLSRVDPAGHPQGGADGTRFDTWTSGVIIVAYAIPGFLFAILLLVLFAGGSYFQIFPLGADLGQFRGAER